MAEALAASFICVCMNCVLSFGKSQLELLFLCFHGWWFTGEDAHTCL